MLSGMHGPLRPPLPLRLPLPVARRPDGYDTLPRVGQIYALTGPGDRAPVEHEVLYADEEAIVSLDPNGGVAVTRPGDWGLRLRSS